MWSSPLLLLVLVFTLNSHPVTRDTSPASAATATTMGEPSTTSTRHASNGPHHTTTPKGVRTPPSTSSATNPSTTLTTTTTTTTTPTPTTTPTTTPRATSRVTPVATATSTTLTKATTTKTATTLASPSSRDSTANSVAVNVGVASVGGRLTLTTPAALIPLRGPGQWTLDADHPVATTLLCGAHSDTVSLAVRIVGRQNCLLDINVTTGAPTAWTLRAAR